MSRRPLHPALVGVGIVIASGMASWVLIGLVVWCVVHVFGGAL